MNKRVPFRLVCHHNGNPVYLRSYPTSVELTINGKTMPFKDYDSAMLFLQRLTKQSQGEERKHHDKGK